MYMYMYISNTMYLYINKVHTSVYKNNNKGVIYTRLYINSIILITVVYLYS